MSKLHKNSPIHDQALDVEGVAMYGDHPDKVVGWLWARSSTDRPVVYVRIGETGRIIPVSEYLKRAELRGMTKPVNNSVTKSAITDILADFVDEWNGVTNQAEMNAAYEKAVKMIVALFKEKQ